MANWVAVFKMKATQGNGPKIAYLFEQVADIDMPGNIQYNVAIDGDNVCSYEEWESSEAKNASRDIPEVWALIDQAIPYIEGKPEMLFQGKNI